jgi:thiol-disulfide isomerase/thioredoxin
MKGIIALACVLLVMFMASPKPQTAEDTKVIVYYFLTNFRCGSCHKIEQYTKEAVEQHFKDELASGKLVFQPVNIDEKENQHFIKDYQLYSKAVVLSRLDAGEEMQHKNLTKVWEYLGDKDKFIDYIKGETSQFLTEASK